MTERTILPTDPIAPEDIENRAADIDLMNGTTWAGSGSAVSFGEGVYLSNAHNFLSANGTGGTTNNAQTYTITLGEGQGPGRDAGDQTITNADVTNIGNYIGSVSGVTPIPIIPATGRQDMVAFSTPGVDGPNSSAIVYENQEDMAGHLRSAGYPGGAASDPITGTAYNHETLMVTDGPLSSTPINVTPTYQTDHIRADADSTSWTPTIFNPLGTTTTEGLAVVPGQSGSGVDIAMDLQSDDSRLDAIPMQDQLMGVATYASHDSTGAVSQNATGVGGGITPITPNAYQGLAGVAGAAAQTNHQMASTAAGTPHVSLTAQEVADKFDEQILMTDQQAVNGSTETGFNGTIFNETSYMNQNVNMTMDLGPGTDTADYYFLNTGINAEINTLSIEVDKTYITHTPIITPFGVSVIPVENDVTDKLSNTEHIVGTGSDDNFVINDLAGVESIDGRDLPPGMFGFAYTENDTLRLSDDIGPVEWGYKINDDGTIDKNIRTVSDGTNTVEFSGIETFTPRDGDTVDGVVQGAATEFPLEIPPVSDELEGASLPNEISLHDAVSTLMRDYEAIENAYDGGVKSPVHEALSHPSVPVMFENLYTHGVETIEADISPELSPNQRASNILVGGGEATREAGLSLPEEQHEVESSLTHQTVSPEPIYEDDHSYGL